MAIVDWREWSVTPEPNSGVIGETNELVTSNHSLHQHWPSILAKTSCLDLTMILQQLIIRELMITIFP